MDKSKAINEANRARKIALYLAESIYKYLGNMISKDELKAAVDSTISDDILLRLDHLYIKKDTYQNIFVAGFMDDPENEFAQVDDTEELILKENMTD